MAPYKIRKEPDGQWSLEYKDGSANFKARYSTWEIAIRLMDEHAKAVRRLRTIFPDWPENWPARPKPIFNRWGTTEATTKATATTPRTAAVLKVSPPKKETR